MKNLILFLFLIISTGIQAQKMIHELPAKTNVDSTNWLFLTGNPTSGKLYKITAANLRDSIVPATDTTSLSNRINLKLNATDTASLSTRINTKQATLVSGTNIKTVNGSTLLGSGNLVIAGGDAIDTTSLSSRIDYIDSKHTEVYAEDYGIVGDGKEVLDAGISTGTAILSSNTAAFTAADVGKVIRIGGAGAAGVELFTTISGYTNPTTVTVADNASSTVSNARILYGTDFTAAIQSLINDCLDENGEAKTILFKPGIYCLAGDPVTTGSNPNSQLYIPLTSYAPSIQQKSIQLKGSTPSSHFIDYASNQRPINSGTIFHSMINEEAAILGSESEVSGYGTFNWVHVIISNIVFRTVSLNGLTDIQPFMSGINASRMNMINLYDVKVENESTMYSCLEPDSGSIGIYLPLNNNGGDIILDHVQVARYFTGIRSSENANGNQVWIYGCNTAIQFDFGYHVSHFNKLMLHWSVNMIRVVGAAYFKIDNCAIEEYPVSLGTRWWNTDYALDDDEATGKGEINFLRVVAGEGVNQAGFNRSDNAKSDDYRIYPIGALFPVDAVVEHRSNQNGSTDLKIVNTTAGTDAEARLVINNDEGSNLLFGMYSGSKTTFGSLIPGVSYLYSDSPDGLVIMSAGSGDGGEIRFATGGNAEKMKLDESGILYNPQGAGFGNTTVDGAKLMVSESNRSIAGAAQTTVAKILGTSTPYDNLLHMDNDETTGRGSFILSNSSSSDWSNNQLAFFSHGTSYASNFYLPTLSGKSADAGWAFINAQGSDIAGLGILTYNADPIVFGTNNVPRLSIKSDGILNASNVPTYADDTAAGVGGLVAGDIFKTSAGDLKIKL